MTNNHKFILLDLNYTLVANSDAPALKKIYYPEKINHQTYREWLLDLLVDTGLPIILFTARPKNLERQTLAHIKGVTGWQPDYSFFSRMNAQPHVSKLAMLKEEIMPMLSADPSDFLSVESNPRTRAALNELGVSTIVAPRGREEWTTLNIPRRTAKPVSLF